MAWWRKHKFENKGILEKGSILASGFSEEIGKNMVISTKSDSTQWICKKCNFEINIIGDCNCRPPKIYGCPE